MLVQPELDLVGNARLRESAHWLLTGLSVQNTNGGIADAFLTDT